mmetsp:Transcript_18999/g.31819  ORF Transcript_18999/g.31819 Transcript_18999/m.31819 type:complete len:209 (+) Transcript_18999:97-723(+)
MATSKACLTRLQKEYQRLSREPVENIVAEPRPNNILEWHFVISGPAGTPYEGGQYHGKLIFPSEYPYKPPAIMMLTPNGRFNTNTRLCLSMSDFHPETWVPAWSVASILNGVLSFMLESTPTVGSVEKSVSERRALARASKAFNRKGTLFCELFPQLVEPLPEGQTEEPEVVEAAAQPRSLLSPLVLGALALAGLLLAAAAALSQSVP